MEKRFEWLILLLNRHNIDYWVDSGTLLGMYRDGALIHDDNDIDISIKRNSETELLNLLNSEIGDDLKLRLVFKNKKLFKIKLYIINPKNKLESIDFNIFDKVSESYYCYQPIKSKNNSFINMFLKLYWKIVMFKKRIHTNYDKFPLRSLYKFRFWVIDTMFIESTQIMELNDITFKIPNKVTDYLSYRYGLDWKVRKKNWKFTTDDGGLHDLKGEDYE